MKFIMHDYDSNGRIITSHALPIHESQMSVFEKKGNQFNQSIGWHQAAIKTSEWPSVPPQKKPTTEARSKQ